MLPETRALVDSGADFTQFPASWAKALGIDLQAACAQGPGTSAGGSTTIFSYAPGITAILKGEKIPLAATFNKDLPVILLGRGDFFSQFLVAFDERAKTFSLTAYS